MGNIVKLTQTVDDRDVVKAFERQLKLIDKLERRLDGSGKAGGKSGDQTTRSWLNANRAINLAGQATQSLIRGLEKAFELQHKVRTEAAGGAETFDQAIRGFLIQQGPGGLSYEQTRDRAASIATAAGVSNTSVLRIAKQLTSTGFADPLAQGGSTEAIISFLQSTAQNADQADLEGIVSAFAQQLQASKQELTGRNLLRLAVQTRGLFASTPLEAPDLIEFAKARGIATQLGVNQPEFLAASAVVKEQLSAAEGATGLGNFFSKLAAPKRLQLGALEQLGLNPEDVDFVGESLPEVAKRLDTALQALPEERRTAAVGRLFGAEKSQLTAAFALLEAGRTGKLEQYQGLTGDVAGYQYGIELGRNSAAAARQRVESQIELEQTLYTEGVGASELTLEKAKELRDIRRRRVLTEEGRTIQLGVETFLDANAPRIAGDYTAPEREVARQATARGQGATLSDDQIAGLRQDLRDNTAATRQNTRGAAIPEAAHNRRD